jgi:hypothetical protein
MGEALRCRDVHGCSSLDGAGKLHHEATAIKAALPERDVTRGRRG